MLYPHLIDESSSGGGRIVGGTEAVPNSRPYIVTLNIDVLYFCGGTLIGKFKINFRFISLYFPLTTCKNYGEAAQ